MTKHRLAFITFLACQSLTIQPLFSEDLTWTETDAGTLFRTSGELFQQQKYPAAAKSYREFLRQFSGDMRAADAQAMLAESLYRQALAESASSEGPSDKIFVEAQKEYQSALGRIPKGDMLAENAAYRLGEIAFNLKRYNDAIGIFQRMLADYPGGLLRGEARLLQSQAFLAQKNGPEALRIIKAVFHDQPTYEQNAGAQLTYGIALYETGDPAGALAHLDKLDTPLADLYAGRALMSSGKPLVAVEKFRHIPEIDPLGRWVEISNYLVAEAFFTAKDYVSAIQAYQDFNRRYPQSIYQPGSLYKIGVSQYETGDFLAARGSFQSVQQLYPKNEFAELSLYMTGESFLKEVRLKEAGFAYGEMAASYQDAISGNAQFKLGWTLFKQDDLAGAESALRLMPVRYPKHPLTSAALFLLGTVLAHQERYPEAVVAFQQSLDMLETATLPEEQRTDLRESCLALLNRANLMNKDYGALVSGYQYILNHVKPSLNAWRAATLLYIGDGYYRQGLYEQALAINRSVLASFSAAPESALAVDGIAWDLFQEGRYLQSEQERQKLEPYLRRPSVAPSKTILPDGKLPESLFNNNEFEIATARFNRKKYLEALDGYEGFEKTHPNSPLASEAALQAGWCYYRLEYYGQAIKTWQRVETSYANTPSAAKAAWSTADTYFRAAQYDQAVEVYRRILQAYPQDTALNYARLRIALSYYNGRDMLKAVAAFEDLLNAAPGSPESSQVLDFLTQLLYRPESSDLAVQSLSRIADQHAGTTLATQARWRLAKHLFETGKYAEAAQGFETVVVGLLGEDQMAEAQFDLAECYYNLKRYEDAALAYGRFTSNYPGDKRYVAGMFHLGTSRFQTKDFAGAAEAFQAIAKNYPKSDYAPVALFNSALAYRKLGKWEETALALKTYMKDYPQEAKASTANSELVAVYEEHHQFPLAIDTLAQMRDALAPGEARRLEYTYRIAEDAMSMEDEGKALDEYRALVANPLKHDFYRLSALIKLGDYYEKKEMWAEALGAYEDLARNSTRQDWAQAAKQKLAVLHDQQSQASISVSSLTVTGSSSTVPGPVKRNAKTTEDTKTE